MTEKKKAAAPSAADYQQEAARQGDSVPYDQAAAQAVGAVVDPDAAGTDADAGPSIAQMQQERREALLPFEQRINDMMAQFEAQRDAMAGQIEQLQRQLATTQAQVGPAAVTLYADAAHQRLQSVAAANPDVGAAHFAEVIGLTGKLAAAAKDVTDGTSDPGVLARYTDGIRAWFASRGGKYLEGAGTVLHDLDHLAVEAAKLTA